MRLFACFVLCALAFGPAQAKQASTDRLVMGRTQVILTDGEWSATLDPKNGCGMMRQNGPVAIGVMRVSETNVDLMILADQRFEPLVSEEPVEFTIDGQAVDLLKSEVIPKSEATAAGPLMVFSTAVLEGWSDRSATIEIWRDGKVIHTDTFNPGQRVLDSWRKCAQGFTRP